jgi:hypothetical protein
MGHTPFKIRNKKQQTRLQLNQFMCGLLLLINLI